SLKQLQTAANKHRDSDASRWRRVDFLHENTHKKLCAQFPILAKMTRCFRRRSAPRNQREKRALPNRWSKPVLERTQPLTSDFWKRFAGCCWHARSRKSSLVFIVEVKSPAASISAKGRKRLAWRAVCF